MARLGVWLGKQMLGQRKTITTEHVGMGGGPIQLAIQPDLSKLTDAEFEQLLDLTRKTMPSANDGAVQARDFGAEGCRKVRAPASSVILAVPPPAAADSREEVSHEQSEK